MQAKPKSHSWALLRQMAAICGLTVFAKLGDPSKTIAILKEKIQDLLDEAQAIENLAEKEDREPTEDEQDRFSAIMDEESGELVALQKQLAQAEKIDRERRRLAQARQQLNQRNDPFDGGQIDDGAGGDPIPQNRLPRVISRIGSLRVFRGENAERDAFDSGMFLRARIGQLSNNRDQRAESYLEARGLVAPQAAQTEGTDSAGGFLVPDPLSRAIIDYRELFGIANQLCRVVPMTSDTLAMPKRVGGLTVYYPGEATSITESNKNWSRVNLTAVKRAVLTKISQELNEDALINVVDDVASEIALALAVAKDNELINGDGTATYGGETGLLSALGAAGKSAASGNWGATVLSDFTTLMSILPAKFWAGGPSWVCSPAFYYSVMLKVLSAAGGNTLASLEIGGRERPMFLGYPVFFTDQMPTSYVSTGVPALFGSFRQAVIIGERTGVEIGQSDQFAFDEDVITVKGRTRYDIAVHEPGDGSDAGAYVGLQTP